MKHSCLGKSLALVCAANFGLSFVTKIAPNLNFAQEKFGERLRKLEPNFTQIKFCRVGNCKISKLKHEFPAIPRTQHSTITIPRNSIPPLTTPTSPEQKAHVIPHVPPPYHSDNSQSSQRTQRAERNFPLTRAAKRGLQLARRFSCPRMFSCCACART